MGLPAVSQSGKEARLKVRARWAWTKHLEPWLIGIALVVSWHLLTSTKIMDPALFGTPVTTLKSGLQQVVSPRYWPHVLHSAQVFTVGIGLAIVVGVGIGLLIAWSDSLQALLDPVLMLVYTLPREAIIPLLLIWFGIGKTTEGVVAFMGAFFPIMFNTLVGIRTVDQNLVRAARAFMAKPWNIFRAVLLPGALPSIMTGIRLGIGRAIMGVVVAEMYMGIAGLGSLIVKSQAGFNVERMLFNTFVVSTLGFLAVRGAKWVERRFSHWREEAT